MSSAANPKQDSWGREDDPSLARTRLLEAAGRVFARKGVVDVTIADVANAAGCTRGTVHRYFGDRESLRLAFVNHHAEQVAARVAKRLRGVSDPAALLRDAVLLSVAEVRSDPVLSTWFSDASATTAGRLALSASVVTSSVSGLVREVIRRAKQSGELRRGVDAETVTDAVVRLIISLLTLPVSPSPSRTAGAAERRLVDKVLVASVMERPPTASAATR